jgi:DNA-binding PadR family transcriptional regulator
MTSVVNWVLLGIVIERQGYGLELYHRYERIYGDVLPVSSESHIYHALDVLVDRGMAEEVPGPVGRQPKPHYRATKLGVRSYEDWVVAQIDDERRRQELWVRQLAIFAHDPAAALDVIGRFERRHLQRAGQVGHSLNADVTHPRKELINELVGEWQRINDGGMLSWLQYAQERFEALDGEPSANDAPRA